MAIGLLCSAVQGAAPTAASATASATTRVVSQRVQDLVASMSLKDKVGQMAELDVAIAINWWVW